MSQIMWSACLNRRATRRRSTTPDVPDNLQPFAQDLAEQQPDLAAFKYGVIALGDRSYDTFCQGGKTLDRLLAECGANRIGERLEIDVTQHEIPEDAAETWIHDWMTLIG